MVPSSIEKEKRKKKDSIGPASVCENEGREEGISVRFNLFSDRSVLGSGQISREGSSELSRGWWGKKGRDVLYGKTGTAPTSRRQRGKGRSKRDFMSRNSPPGAPRLCSILSSWCPPTRRTKQNNYSNFFPSTYIHLTYLSLLLFPLSSSGDKFVVDVFVPVYTSRNRNSAATRKCLAFLRPVQSPEDVILSPLFRTRNAYRYDTRRAWTPVVIDVFGEEEKCDCNLSFFPDDSPLEELLSHGASRSLPFCLRFAIDLPSFPFDTTYISSLFQLFEKVFNLSVDEREEKKSIDFCNSINETDGSARSDTVERNRHRLCSSFLFRFPSSIVASIHPPFIAVIREPDVSKTFPILFFYFTNYRQFRSHRID